jgi:hypothetical protein
MPVPAAGDEREPGKQHQREKRGAHDRCIALEDRLEREVGHGCQRTMPLSQRWMSANWP